MSRNEYEKELEKLYKMAVEQKDIKTALDILERRKITN